MKNNYLQVGRTQQCGHCSPSLQKIEDVAPQMVCDCICHYESIIINRTSPATYKTITCSKIYQKDKHIVMI